MRVKSTSAPAPALAGINTIVITNAPYTRAHTSKFIMFGNKKDRNPATIARSHSALFPLYTFDNQPIPYNTRT